MLQFITNIGNLIPSLFGRVVSDKAARIVGVVTIAIILLAVISVAKAAYDESVRNTAEVEHKAEAAERQLQADRAADSETADKAAQFDNSQQQIEQAAREAERREPEAASREVGPVTRSYYENLPRRKKP